MYDPNSQPVLIPPPRQTRSRWGHWHRTLQAMTSQTRARLAETHRCPRRGKAAAKKPKRLWLILVGAQCSKQPTTGSCWMGQQDILSIYLSPKRNTEAVPLLYPHAACWPWQLCAVQSLPQKAWKLLTPRLLRPGSTGRTVCASNSPPARRARPQLGALVPAGVEGALAPGQGSKETWLRSFTSDTVRLESTYAANYFT